MAAVKSRVQNGMHCDFGTHLDLRSSRRPRLAHRICAMHLGGFDVRMGRYLRGR